MKSMLVIKTILLLCRILDRPIHGQYEALLMSELYHNDEKAFKNFTRLPTEMYDEVLSRIETRLKKKDTRWRDSLPAGLKLAVVLRHIATGDSYKTLMYGFRVSDSAISKFLPSVLRAIIEEYAEEVIDTPTTPEEWMELEDTMRNVWQVPHSFGGIDGKHVRLFSPKKSGSLYHNYKGFCSIVLLAFVDGNLRFRWIDVGANGSCSDTQIFNDSELNECIQDGTVGFPEPDPLPGDTEDMPYFLLGDDIFGLKSWMMKPIPGKVLSREERIYNYRISRGRRVVENAFGVLAHIFQILLKPIAQDVDTAQLIVMCCVVLHNLMRIRYPTSQNKALDKFGPNGNVSPGEWRKQVNWSDKQKLKAEKGNRDLKEAKIQRLTLVKYFNSSVGSVPWQEKMV